MSVVCYCLIFARSLVLDLFWTFVLGSIHSFAPYLDPFVVFLDSVNTMDKFDLEWYVNVLILVCPESKTT